MLLFLYGICPRSPSASSKTFPIEMVLAIEKKPPLEVWKGKKITNSTLPKKYVLSWCKIPIKKREDNNGASETSSRPAYKCGNQPKSCSLQQYNEQSTLHGSLDYEKE